MTVLTMQEETAPLPRFSRGKVTYKGFGFGEVKSHNARGIAAGLSDLQKRYQQARRPKPDVYLVTYMYEKGKDTFRINALRPHKSIVEGRSPTVVDGAGWIDRLGTWYDLGVAALPAVPGDKTWIDRVGPVARGSMLEPIARDVFIRSLRPMQHLTAFKMPHEPGADIRWKELAEYLYELASELSPGR